MIRPEETMVENSAVDTLPASAPVPRWAVWAAHAVPLCILPSAVWRAAYVVTGHDPSDTPLWYPLLLSAASMGLGLLTLGLVHSWGEVVPPWVPLLGGRRVPTLAAVVPAVLGATALIAITASVTYNWFTLDAIPVENAVDGDRRPLSERPEAVWVVWAYTPMAAWGPLLLAVAAAYYRRRSRSSTIDPLVRPH